MPRVFGRGSRSQPAALVSDRDDAALFPAIRILERYGSAKSARARRVRTACRRGSLYLSGTVQRIHYAVELGEGAVARRLDEPAVMRGDRRVDQFDLNRFEGIESARLVCSNQPRVAGHISGENRGETTGLAHIASPAARRRPESSSSRCSGFRKQPSSGTTT